jgi:hypothetical protein
MVLGVHMGGSRKPKRAPKGQLADPNIIRAVALARLTHNDLGLLWHLFKRWDQEKEGKITINDLMGGVLGETRNMFTDSVLELLEIKEEEKASYELRVLLSLDTNHGPAS